MFNPLRSLIRVLGFCDKEILEVARQPKLMLTLVLGPFLILFLFGIGYRSQRQPLRTLFVAEKNDPISEEIYHFLPALGPQLDFRGITGDLKSARNKLQNKEIDVIVVAPENTGKEISENRQAVFTLLHDEMNPVESDYIRLTGEVFVDKLNHQLLDSVVATERKQLQLDIQVAIETIRRLRSQLEDADITAARESQTSLNNALDRIAHSLRSRLDSSDSSPNDQVRDLLSNMANLHAVVTSSLVPEQSKRNYAMEIQNSASVENNLIVLASQVQNLKTPDAYLMLAPFSSKTENLTHAQPQLAEYFSPGILILLLQHLAIVLSALSLVREFRGRNLEVLRVSPVRDSELLLGKSSGVLIVCAVISSLLTMLVVYGLRVQMIGDWMQYGVVICSVLFPSIAIGMFISALSDSEEQSILLSMLLFLSSILFTGLFLNLDLLWSPLRIISYLFPATYGIRLVQDVMLRGDSVAMIWIEILVVLGLVFSLAASIFSRRRFTAEIQRA